MGQAWRDCVVTMIDVIGVKKLAHDGGASKLMRRFHDLVIREMATLRSVAHAYVWNDSVLLLSYVNERAASFESAIRDLVAKKRPMFAYEQEVRVVLSADGKGGKGGQIPTEQETSGHGLEWDPEKHVEWIRVHPEADHSFMETVAAAVEHYAPALKDRVEWSAMTARPPF